MIKKQKIVFKKNQFFLYLLIFSCLGAYCQNNNQLLRQADSLFHEKKYTESFEIYEGIFTESKASSPAMLLKMAFIKEGLGDYTQALYYLNTYFNLTLDENALNKINELAKNYELKGYQNNERPFIHGALKKYLESIRLGITIILVAIVALIIFFQTRSQKRSVLPFVNISIILILIILLNNIRDIPQSGIISGNATYLMTGPSGAADVVDIVNKGHKVKILGQNGVWVKIDWEGQVVYLRENKILPLI